MSTVVITRNVGDQIAIVLPSGEMIILSVNRIKGRAVRIGINAPSDCVVKRPDSHPLEETSDRAWPVPRDGAACKLCGDSGWLIAVLRRSHKSEFTFRCSCPAGESLAVDAPRWTGDARYKLPGETPPQPKWGADLAAGPDE